MRTAREADLWPNLVKRFADLPPEEVTSGGVTIDLSAPCTVLGGRNGAGKSRALRALAEDLGQRAVHIDIPTLCEQALSVVRGLTDVEDLKEATGPMLLSTGRLQDLQRIVGRDYEQVDWYGLDIVPGDDEIAENFTWGSDQPVTPYFEATYRSTKYNGSSMGLGEYSVHLLFWILQQYEHVDELVILIDEPDAYLPPSAATGLLARLLNVCKERRDRGWRVILSTHSADIIADAVGHSAFVYLDLDQAGDTVATHCKDDPTVADVLLARPPVRQILFVEDETAYHLTRAIIATLGRDAMNSTSVVWGRGSGNLKALGDHLPRQPHSALRYAIVFDGDQRTNKSIPPNSAERWPSLFLPTSFDPDVLISDIADTDSLALKIGQPQGAVIRVLGTLEGSDPHDRVNGLADHFGRPVVLPALAALWVEGNSAAVAGFIAELNDAF